MRIWRGEIENIQVRSEYVWRLEIDNDLSIFSICSIHTRQLLQMATNEWMAIIIGRWVGTQPIFSFQLCHRVCAHSIAMWPIGLIVSYV